MIKLSMLFVKIMVYHLKMHKLYTLNGKKKFITDDKGYRYSSKEPGSI